MSTITADQPKTKRLSLSHTHYFVFRKREEENDVREGGREGKREGGKEGGRAVPFARFEQG